MSRIGVKFNELRELNKKALITFVTAGDPDLDGTKRIVEAMERNGADLIELGIPYSDPVAEGPVIQAANVRALKNNIKIKDIMNAVKDMRKTVEVPLIYLLYYNCIFKYGADRFFSDCADSGIDGVIIPDLPFEEKDEIDGVALKYGIDIISMVSPVSKERIEMISKSARGFLYCVSSLGVTGERNSFSTDFGEFFSIIDKYTSIPKAIGFGISTPEHVKSLKGYSDGLIVGSAMVRQIERSRNIEETIDNITEYVKVLRAALDS